jgi:hypothetical protein
MAAGRTAPHLRTARELGVRRGSRTRCPSEEAPSRTLQRAEEGLRGGPRVGEVVKRLLARHRTQILRHQFYPMSFPRVKGAAHATVEKESERARQHRVKTTTRIVQQRAQPIAPLHSPRRHMPPCARGFERYPEGRQARARVTPNGRTGWLPSWAQSLPSYSSTTLPIREAAHTDSGRAVMWCRSAL